MEDAARGLPRYVRFCGYAIVVLLFGLACIVGRSTTYLVLIAGILMVATPSLGAAFAGRSRNPIDWMLLLAAILPGLAFLFTFEEPSQLRFALNFAPLLLAIPVRWQLERMGRGDGASLLAWLSLIGAAIAAGVAFVQVAMMGMERAGQPLMSAFQFADTAVLLGFFALAGLLVPGGRWRYLLLLGPVLGITAAILGGTRGAAIAAPVLAVLAIGFGYAKARDRRLFAVLAAGGLLVFTGLVVLFDQMGFGRATEGFGVALDALRGEAVDSNTDERLVMYWGGLQAFLAAPLFGYGWPDMVKAILPFLTPEDAARMTHFRHLHNGLLSFAVGAGVPGIISFLMLSVAPMVAVFQTKRDEQFAARLYLATTLCAGYAMFQLTILMLGFEFHTVQYAFMTVAILAIPSSPKTAVSAVV